MKVLGFSYFGMYLLLSAFLSSSVYAQQQWPGFFNGSAMLSTWHLDFESQVGKTSYYDGTFCDINGDGHIDRVLASRFGLAINKGDGEFEPAGNHYGPAYPGAPLTDIKYNQDPTLNGYQLGAIWGGAVLGDDTMLCMDIDNDGDVDTGTFGTNEAAHFEKTSEGRSKMFSVTALSGQAAHNVNQVVIEDGKANGLNNTILDANGDGFGDIALVNGFCDHVNTDNSCADSTFRLLINDGTGRFVERSTASGFTGNFSKKNKRISGTAAADVDNDGDIDLIVAPKGNITGVTSAFWLMRNNGSGIFTGVTFNFATPLASNLSIVDAFKQALKFADLDNDGDQDLIVDLNNAAANSKIKVAYFENDGAGHFTEKTASHFNMANYTGVLAGQSKLVDVDLDGDIDFITYSKQTWLLNIMLNDGTGHFTFDPTDAKLNIHMRPANPANPIGFGMDVDVGDINGDGAPDIYIGEGGKVVEVLINKFNQINPGATPVNVPRNAHLSGVSKRGIRIAWDHPAYAETNRYYKVYRSTAPRLALQYRQLLKTVGSKFQSNENSAPITIHTTNQMLGDPYLRINGPNGDVQISDSAAKPGVRYYYSIVHVGTGQSASVPTAEIPAMIPPQGGQDTMAPELQIMSPTDQTWRKSPTIVLAYGDGGSGIDLTTLNVSFNKNLGPYSAGTNLSVASFFRKDSTSFILPLVNNFTTNQSVTLTAKIRDLAGNLTTRNVSFFVEALGNSPVTPIVDFDSIINPNGNDPLAVRLSGLASRDPDGVMLSYEWYLPNGTTSKDPYPLFHFPAPGSYPVSLIAGDTEGNTANITKTVIVP